jgi:hypothetical protein
MPTLSQAKETVGGKEHMGKIDELIAQATAEWEFFEKQEYDIDGTMIKRGKQETDEGFWQRVGIYWGDGVGQRLTGKNTDFPWSAAFISFLMQKVQAGARFKFSAQHSVYIRAAIRAREREDTKYGFWGFRLSERAPEVGDLVCYAREAGISFDTKSADYKAHADLVIEKLDGAIRVIGGNVGNSVSRKTLRLNDQSLLVDDHHAWFAVLQNRLDMAVA